MPDHASFRRDQAKPSDYEPFCRCSLHPGSSITKRFGNPEANITDNVESSPLNPYSECQNVHVTIDDLLRLEKGRILVVQVPNSKYINNQ